MTTSSKDEKKKELKQDQKAHEAQAIIPHLSLWAPMNFNAVRC